MIILHEFLTKDDASSLERLVRDGAYKSVVTHFQPEPTPLKAESFGPVVSSAAENALKYGVKIHDRLIQPKRLKAVSGPDFIRFLDGMSLGYAPVPALHDADPATRTGMRCDALIHVRLSATDQYVGGDMQTASSDRASQRLALAQGDAILFNWEDIFALRVVHQGPLLHMVFRLQYQSGADTFDALSPLAEAAKSQNPAIAGPVQNLFNKVTTL